MGFIANKLNQSVQPTAPSGGGGVFARAAAPSQPSQVNSQSVIKKLASKYQSGANNFSEGAGKGILSTIKGLGQFGEKVGNALLPKAFEAPSVYSDQALEANKAQGGKMGRLLSDENLEAKGFAQSFGKGAEQIGEFFIPAGKVNAVEKLLASGAKLKAANLAPIVGEKLANIIGRVSSLGTKMGVRATEGGGVITLQSGGDKEQVKTASKVGAAFPPVTAVGGKVLSKVGQYGSGFAKRLAGALSGRGTAVIDEIAADPKAALEGLMGESVDVLTKDAKFLKEAAVGMKEGASKEYSRVLNVLQDIYENEGKSFDKGTEINKITDAIQEKFGITKKGKVAELTGEAVDDAGDLDFVVTRFQKPNEQNTIKNALKYVKSYRDAFNPKNMEHIASTIDKMKGSDAELNGVLHTITNSLRNSVADMGEQAGYKEGADLTRNFAIAMDKIDAFTSKFKANADDLRPVQRSPHVHFV